MATSNAIRSAGSQFQVLISGTWTRIPDATGGDGLGGEAAKIEHTPIDETENKHFLTDLADPGELTLEASFVPGNTVHNYLLTAWKAGTLEQFRIIYSNGLITSFAARVSNFVRSIQRGAVVGAQITLAISGAITDP